MECPRCRADIREASRFCDECGSPLRAQCSSCGGENRPDAKFCSQCGIGLSEPTTKAGAAAGATAVRTSSAERRQLTVMFVDLVGSTALSARVDPEDLREVLGAYHKCVAETVRRFQGFVANYMGDGGLAAITTPFGSAADWSRAARFGVSPTTLCSRAPPAPIWSPTTTRPVAMPTRLCSSAHAVDLSALTAVTSSSAARTACSASSSCARG